MLCKVSSFQDLKWSPLSVVCFIKCRARLLSFFNKDGLPLSMKEFVQASIKHRSICLG